MIEMAAGDTTACSTPNNGIEQQRSLTAFFDWYNHRRPHQSLGWQTPDEAYFSPLANAAPKAA
ncbi:MAG: integrase core domain-containing protein [Propionivibrio sp.]